MTFKPSNPRELEDVVVACPDCGEFPTGTVLGERDWLARRPPHGASPFEDGVQREVHRLVSGAEQEEDEDEDGAVVTAERVDVEGREDDELDCDGCQRGLGLTWGELAAAHRGLSGGAAVWLESYVRMKDLVRHGLFLENVALRTGLGTFINVTSRLAELRPDAMPLFLASPALIERAAPGALQPEQLLRMLASEETCRAGERELALPSQYEGARVTVDLELAVGLEEIAAQVRAMGAAPLRGLGTLRRLEYEWDSDDGMLLYLDFDEALRAAMSEQVDDG